MQVSDVGKGALIAAGCGAGGAAVGYVSGPACTPNQWLCGPGWNAMVGFSLGTLAAGLGGLVVAATSAKHRDLGLGTASAVGILVGFGLVRQALMPSTVGTVPDNTVPAPPVAPSANAANPAPVLPKP
jgi:hypothetical protein